LIILDAGTGIRELGRLLISQANGASIEADIFLTHAHWDHIQGIPFFAPIFQKGNHFTIWGSQTLAGSVDRVVRDQMSPVVFPVKFEEISAHIDFCTLANQTENRNGYRVSGIPVRHPGGALGYRFEDSDGKTFVYISDNELGPGGNYESRQDWRKDLVTFVRGARVLIHDSTYTTGEYDQHAGWGHSTYAESVELALEAGIEELVLFHHKPERSDDELDRCVEECRALVKKRGGKLIIRPAAEGMTLDV